MKQTSNSTLLESNIQSTLKEIGLFPNDIKVYEYLINYPLTKTGPIISGTKISSSAVYQSLDNLKNEGLVSYEVRNNIKYYRAESPQQLIDQLQENKKQLESLTKIIEDAKTLEGPRNIVNVYEGSYGFKRAFQQFIEGAEENTEVNIIGYNITNFINDIPLRNFFTELDKGLQGKNIKAKVLAEKNLIPTFKRDRRGIDIYEVKTLPPRYFGPYAIDTTEKEVLISIITGTPIAISIKHPIIVDAFRKNFEYLWKSAKEV